MKIDEKAFWAAYKRLGLGSVVLQHVIETYLEEAAIPHPPSPGKCAETGLVEEMAKVLHACRFTLSRILTLARLDEANDAFIAKIDAILARYRATGQQAEQPVAKEQVDWLSLHPAVIEDIIRGALETVADCQSPITCSKAVMKVLGTLPARESGGQQAEQPVANAQPKPEGV